MELWLMAALGALGLLLLFGALVSIFRQVPPNRALIVYGFGMADAKIVTGGGTLVIPILQGCNELSLELMSFDVAPEQALYTSQGVALNVEAVTQIKVKSDSQSIRTAAEQFLTKPTNERENLIRLVMEGHLRGIVGLLTVEQIVKEPERVAGQVRETVASDLTKMGLELISFTIKKVTDEQDYIRNMGLPDAARIRQVAAIAEAEAEREIAMKKAIASREAAVAQALADQETVLARSTSEAEQAKAVRDLNVKQAEYAATVNQERAKADKAGEIASNQAEQLVVAERVKVAQVEKGEQIKVQQLEVQRKELELASTTIKQAEAEQRRIQVLAEAEKSRLAAEAEGRARALAFEGEAKARVARETGLAEAEVIKARGEAEAAVLRAKGEAEAEAMQKRADAFERYTQAAILDKVVTSLPEMASAMATSLNKVDRITLVGTGGQGGASALTGEVAKMVAQVPELVEGITGVKVSDMLRQLQGGQAQEVKAIPVEGE